MVEVWKSIAGFENYQVSSLGRLRRDGRILKGTKDKHGYTTVFLCKNGKQHHAQLHRIVAQMFIPNPMGLDTVDHIDSDKSNNSVANLQWMSLRENVQKSHRERGHKIYDTPIVRGVRGEKLRQPIIQIDLEGNTIRYFNSMMDAERVTGIGSGRISNCVNGRKKTAGGYIWRRKITPKGESESNT